MTLLYKHLLGIDIDRPGVGSIGDCSIYEFTGYKLQVRATKLMYSYMHCLEQSSNVALYMLKLYLYAICYHLKTNY